MVEAEHPHTWRQLLAQLTQNERRRQHVLAVVGINQMTLHRWITNVNQPRRRSLELLLEAFPQERSQLQELLVLEFPELTSQQSDEAVSSTAMVIPSPFYAQVLETTCSVSEALRFWTISTLVLQQALSHLDPNHVGVALTVVQCLPSGAGGEIRSLRERLGRATPPWPAQLESDALLLGAESLVGYTVMKSQAALIQSRVEETRFPAHWTQWEQSAAAYPVLRSGKIAGALQVSCAQEGFFVPWRHQLLEHYAQLLTLAFEPTDFVPLARVHLHWMPPYERQQRHFSQLRSHIVRIQLEAQQQGPTLSYQQAELLAWQQVEEELLHLPAV